MAAFLIDASVPREANVVVVASGHSSTDVRDVGLRHASDDRIAEYAKVRQLCIVSRDFDFADVRVYPPHDYFGIVVLNPTHRGDRQATLALLRDFLREDRILRAIAGRLAVVEPLHIRLRPPL
jgi:hypothetical protein